MPRNIKLRDDPDPAGRGVRDDPAHLFLREVMAVGAEFVQVGKFLALDAEALVLGQVQVQDVELYERHAVEVALDDLQRLPVARHIDHQAAPGKTRPVLDAHRRQEPPGGGVRLEQLQQCFEAMQGTEHGRSPEDGLRGSYLETVRLVLAEYRDGGTRRGAFDHAGGTRSAG